MAKNKAYEKYKITRTLILNKFNKRCAYCGCSIEYYGFHMDHIIPKLRGRPYKDIPYYEKGSDDIENLFPACSSCNSSKSSMSLEQFRSHILDRLYRLNSSSSHYQIIKRFGLVEETKKEIIFYFETIPDNAQ